MKVALIGLPGSGKTSLFNAVSEKPVDVVPGLAGAAPHVASVRVRDERLEWLRDHYSPKKYTPASLAVEDHPGIPPGAAKSDRRGELFSAMRNAESIVVVLNAFSEDPAAELELVSLECSTADHEICERRLKKLEDEWKNPKLRDKVEREKGVVERVAKALEDGHGAHTVDLRPDEEVYVKGFQLLTRKPAVLLVNTTEEGGAPELPPCALHVLHHFEGCASLEADLAALEGEEREMFAAEYGVREPLKDRFVLACYRGLGLLSFFTVGEDEVKASTIQEGDDAVTASGKIHTDLARGFIRAEVTPYDALRESGSMRDVKAAGKQRLEGKDYKVADGDILNIRFSVLNLLSVNTMSIPKAAILTVGNELLDGRVVNSNAAYLAYRLTDIGFLVAATETVGDDEFAIADAVKGLTGRADTVIVVGGLGPTQDDVTREALAGAAGKLLQTDRALKKRITEHTKGTAARRNSRMALLPEGATIFDNPIGTAPGLCVDTGGTPVYALPGVPMEMEAIFEESIKEHLADYFGASPLPVRILRIFGLKEAETAEKIDDLMERGTGITARHGVITVVVSGDDADECADAMRERLGDHVFGEGDTTLAEVVLGLLKEAGLTIAMAESITGGLVTSLLVDRPGASAVLKGGVIAYATPMKEKLLGVSGRLLEEHGAVSSEVALEMAEGARRELGADVGVATTGVAGPARDERGEPVGHGFIAVVTPDASRVIEVQARGDREAIRARFAWTAYDLVRRLL